LGELDGVSLDGFELQQEGARLGLSVTVYSSHELQPEIGDSLITALTRELGEEVSLRLRVISVSETVIP
jgi:F0F1-type ATP synthase delta subunit